MKILFISELLMWRDSGAKVCTWAHAELLYKISSALTVVNIYRDMDEEEIDKKKFEKYEKTIFIKAFHNKLENYSNILTLNGWFLNKRIIRTILEEIRGNSYDFIFVDDSIMGRLVREIKKEFPTIKVATYYHDVKAELSRQWIRDGGIKVLPYNIGIMLNERINQKFTDVNIVLNGREDKLLFKHYGIKSDAILPVCVNDVKDISIFNRNEVINRGMTEILFVGAYYGPNVQGIKWFIDNVFSKLDRQYKLVIAGSEMEQLVCEIEKNDRISICGWVESLDDLYMSADIVIAPIFKGGGMKIKTAEAMSYGKCFIGTTESFEGYLEYIPSDIMNSYVFLSNTAEEFLQAIKKISMNEKAMKWNKEVREIYLENFSEVCMKRKINSIIEEACRK